MVVVKALVSNAGGRDLIPSQGGKSHLQPKKTKHKTEIVRNSIKA